MNLKEIGNKKFLDKGNLSKCYLLEDSNVLKIFNTPRKLYEMDNFKYFFKFSNDSFGFPFEFIYDTKKFYGYIMKKMPGKKLSEVFSSSFLNDLSRHSHKLERDIDFVSSGGIVLYDFHEDNLLYNGNKYSVIDPDENGIVNSSLRAKEFNHRFHRVLIGNLFLGNLENIKHTKVIRDNITKYKYMDLKPSQMIFQVKDDMEKYTKEQIETVDDFNRIIRK